MIPYEIDPSLHPAGPTPPQLDDGFSPPAQEPGSAAEGNAAAAPEVDPSLWTKSDF
ncbi:MAG TPA: hypothetical protein VEA40_23530 [Ramlibacter sp.]|nr:hypothetical protein [Ramlibacter sp.]